MQIRIRAAQKEDAGAIAELLPALGYQAELDQIRLRLNELLCSSHHAIFLAIADGGVVGLCLVGAVRHLASPGFAEVFELVVQIGFQRRGIGSLLLGHAQAWAAHHGHSRVRLRSGVHRTEAHQFYERLGYSKSRASYAFERSLARSDG